LVAQVIKTCRDIQKDAKNAIYALHRNDMKRASGLLGKCEEV
jgi:predicted translin family RNA/ssDNA-binding protein